ncbi:MAG: SDR family NAD(P)-dependent oxidoreductase [Candidatus Poribacteria bacterium]|nr:SDR family NAD(P)-dependent oxidoreductase [Candidatus Poribacteria bacterium]
MAERLKNKVAIVTGAGSIGPGWGNGKATAVLFAREGAKVFAVDINHAAAEETQAIIDQEGGQCTTHQTDVSKAEAVRAMVEHCMSTYGRIDILHNNVGIVEVGGCVEASEESWDRVNAVNLKSIFLTCKYVLPYMEQQGGGAIVNISSIASIRWLGVPYVSYSATKGAINQMTQSIAVQYAKKNIRVNAILPGFMNTPMVAKSLADAYADGDVEKMIEVRNNLCPMGKMGDAWDVAHAALFLASDEAKYITGTELVVDGGLTCKCV